MTNTTNQNNELRELTYGITISARPAYNGHGPDIGVRGAVGGDVRNDFVKDSQGNPWLIAGDIISVETGDAITSLHVLRHMAPNDIVVKLRGQALLSTGLERPCLGIRRVATVNVVSDELVLVRLAD
ncbi:MAG: hypothetical protein IJ419_11995 [Agathobacter sp.]|nr:hypothetical protein [Agathobacter sp.]